MKMARKSCFLCIFLPFCFLLTDFASARKSSLGQNSDNWYQADIDKATKDFSASLAKPLKTAKAKSAQKKKKSKKSKKTSSETSGSSTSGDLISSAEQAVF
jgi:hypothetical protein